MKEGRMSELLEDIGFIAKKIVKSRIIPIVILSGVLFALIIHRIFYLQIINGDSYKYSYIMKMKKTVTTSGTRGNIYDRNGTLLAYSELAYSVVIEDCGSYESKKVKNQTLNEIIAHMVNIIESHGDTVDYDFPVEYDNVYGYKFTISDNELLRFLRDVYGKKAISELSEEERNSTAAMLIDTLKTRYAIDSSYDNLMALKIAYIRYNLSLNSYKRYISFTVASNINQNTMSSILENSDVLTGVTIKEQTIRKYNYSNYIAHIIGYTGKISSEEYDKFSAIDSSYENSDIVGKAGIEAEYEIELSGTKGYTDMLVDSVGHVVKIEDYQDPVAGNDVYLTIDIDLQKKIYNLMERRLSEILCSVIVNSDATTGGVENEPVIPIAQVYFALINNNLISMDQISEQSTEASQQVYSLFSTKKDQALEAIRNELSTGTVYSALSDEMKDYIKLIRSDLLNNAILNSDKITSSDELSQQWSDGSISFVDYINGAINNEWVNIYNLDVASDYPTTAEVYNAIMEEIIREIDNDSEFDKLIYENLIMNHIITGRQVCLILMDQNAIDFTESEYANIYNGGSTFDFLVAKIKNLDITPAQLALDPCSGSCVLEDPHNGQIIAMVSYPSYDINMFSGTINADYYKQLLNDKTSPLVNRVTQTKIAPGSTFKPLIAVAGLNEGVVSSNTLIECNGAFTRISPRIKCAVYPNKHGALDTVEALNHSCNVYFCELGYRLSITESGTFDMEYGLSRIKYYTEQFGLSTLTGIQLPETVPHASDYNPVASAIGQGTNAYTSLNLARYVSTLANRGTVYNSSVVLKTTDNVTDNYTEPVVANQMNVDVSIWNTVHAGMRKVITDGVMNPLCSRLPVTIAGKSGTAQENPLRGDHACYIMFSTEDDDEIGVVATVMIPYGYAATNAGIMAYYAMSAYYDSPIPEHAYFTINTELKIEE